MTETLQASNRAPTILIADDDPGIAQFLAKRCAKMGFEVQTAANGLQALIMAGQKHPDVMIVDINMPQVDGLTVSVRMLDVTKKPLDVIVITASSYPGTAVRCKSLGAFHVRKGLGLWKGVRSALIEIYPGMANRIADDEKLQFREELREHPRVLVVDADPKIGAFLTSRLRKCGVDTLLAPDAVQAYRMACNEAPSVILLDYPMSNGDTDYLLSRLRSTAATDSVPVFVMSEKRLDEATELRLRRDVCGRPGAVQLFTKPLDITLLFPALQKYCGFLPCVYGQQLDQA
jgi:CheY-like chemotaxis protein